MSAPDRQPLFRRVLGARFETLPEPLRNIHDVEEVSLLIGRCSVSRGRNLPARVLASLMSFPLQGEAWEIRMSMRREDDEEQWIRVVSGERFTSKLRALGDGRIGERIGPLDLHMDLHPSPDGLAFELTGLQWFGLSIPKFLWPRISAHETIREGRCRFDISSSMPLTAR